MTTAKLYDLLEIDTPADFQYFEQLAELLECGDDITQEQFLDVLSMVDSRTMTELIENYFNELTAHLPDESQELFSMVDAVQQRLMLLADGLENSAFRRDLAEELSIFRDWYSVQMKVLVDDEYCSVFEAVTLRREEKLGGQKHRYSFDEALDYPLQELSMNLGKVSFMEEEQEEEQEEQ